MNKETRRTKHNISYDIHMVAREKDTIIRTQKIYHLIQEYEDVVCQSAVEHLNTRNE